MIHEKKADKKFPIIWKDIPGYEGYYKISTTAQVLSLYNRKKPLLMKLTPWGQYHGIALYHKEKGRKYFNIHVLMGMTFLRPLKKDEVYIHKNGLTTDNNIRNIGITTRQEQGEKNIRRTRSKVVEKLDSNGEVIEVYRSATEAARKNYISKEAMLRHLRGEIKHSRVAANFRYAEE